MVKFFTTMELLHLAVLFTVLFTVHGDVVMVSSQGEVRVRPNDEAELTCTTSSEIKYCQFIKPNGKSYIIEKNGFEWEGRISYSGEDVKKDCSIKIRNVEESDNGVWRCEITSVTQMQGSDSITLTVLKAPTSVTLDADSQTTIMPEETQKTFRCSAEGGHPAPTFSWLLDDVPVQVNAKEVEEDKGVGFFQEVTYTPNKKDNGKKLKCVVHSEAYTEEAKDTGRNMAETILDVQFRPVASKDPLEFYDLAKGQRYDVRIAMSMNPAPSEMSWKMQDGTVVPQGSEEGEYMASLAVEGPVGSPSSYEAMLTIYSVKDEDHESMNTLIVKNQHGETEYRFKLFLGERPPIGGENLVFEGQADLSREDEAGSGPVIAIVIIVLIIVVVIAVAVVARSQRLLCFAARLKKGDDEKEKAVEEGSDTESAEHTEDVPAAKVEDTEDGGEAPQPQPQQIKKSLPSRMTSILSAMKKTVGGGKKTSAVSEGPEVNGGEDTADNADPAETREDVVYADLDKSAMSEGQTTLTTENERTEYAEIKPN